MLTYNMVIAAAAMMAVHSQPSPPSTRPARNLPIFLRLDATNTAAEVALFFIGFADATVRIDNANSTGTRKQSVPFPMNDGQQRSIHMQILARSGAA